MIYHTCHLVLLICHVTSILLHTHYTLISSIKILVNTHFVFCVIISHTMLRQLMTSGITYMSLWQSNDAECMIYQHRVSKSYSSPCIINCHINLLQHFLKTSVLMYSIWHDCQSYHMGSRTYQYQVSRSHVTVSVLQATIQFMTESDIMYSIWHGYVRVK